MLILQVEGLALDKWATATSHGSEEMLPGSLTFLPAGSVHTSCSMAVADSSREPLQVVAELSEVFLQAAADSWRTGLPSIQLRELRNFSDPQMEYLLRALYSASLMPGLTDALFGESVSKAIAFRLLGTQLLSTSYAHHRGGIPRRRLQRVLQYIEENLHADLSLAALASVAEMSMFHFGRAFRQSMQTSPHQYLLGRRIDRAKSFLIAENMTIAEVSTAVGFARQNHFARVFQNHTGVTPLEFKRRSI
jgi:AraC-like DNA-binding protein